MRITYNIAEYRRRPKREIQNIQMTADKPTTKKAPQSSDIETLLGKMPALSTEKGKSGPPDIRDVSLRWLAGTILTGVTSIVLMGGALMAAVDGQISFSFPQFDGSGPSNKQAAEANASTAQYAQKSDRPLIAKPETKEQSVLRLSTLTRTADGNHVRTRPFARLSASLGKREGDRRYDIPNFDPVTIFSGSSKFREKGDDEVLYESQVDDEIEIRDIDFPYNATEVQAVRGFSDAEIEARIRQQLPLLRASLSDGTILARAGAIAYIDPNRFDPTAAKEEAGPFDELVVIRSENVSSVGKTNNVARLPSTDISRTVDIKEKRTVFGLIKEDLDLLENVDGAVAALQQGLGQTTLNANHRVRMSYAGGPDKSIPDVFSVYEDGRHITSIARADDGTFVPAREPVSAQGLREEPKLPSFTAKQTSTYRSIFETGLKHEVPRPLIRELIRIYAFDVDFRRSTKTADNIEVFYSLDPKNEKATEDSEILYTALSLDGVKRRYYRFKTSDDNVVDYYDENGRSAKKFLMRQPVPRAKFRSRFGWRRHPILRTSRLHKGVDWSAPRGTPIFAAGNGVIEDAKWFSGYGRWIKIRHANGYKTGYAHMSRFAKGMKPGVRVRQGQIIGYVGSTGLSTGPHLHYEVIVNGRHVDPMRIRLPRGRVLSGNELAEFERERDRIDQLLKEPDDNANQDFALNTAN